MTTASVPGKLILLGEHAAVYGHPALVAAVGLRLSATVRHGTSQERGRVRILLPDTGGVAGFTWPAVVEHARASREAWERYRDAPGRETFAALAEPVRLLGEAHLLKVALGEAARAVDGDDDPGELPSVELTISSRIPVGSGFGSSAAAAVAVVMAYLAFRGAGADLERLHRVSLEVERRQHGLPSGVDNATVLHGGVLLARRPPPDDPSDAVAVEPLGTRSPLLDGIRVYDTGAPAEGTGTVVAAVRALRDRDPARVDAAFERLGKLTFRLREELERIEGDPEALLACFREAHARLEELGVVPEPVRTLVRRIEAEGGAAKISGAGSLRGPGAGNILAYHPEPERLDRFEPLRGLRSHRVALGAPGARVEDAEASADGGAPPEAAP
ncbi:MAG: mevalonate kinase [Thermoanaerobaculia bacterium]